MSRAFRLGITGKIGSGKSTLSKIARTRGIIVLDADSVAKDVMNSNPDVRSKIESVFGRESYSENILNRKFLASKIFTDDSLRIQLEEIVHPATFAIYEEEFRKAKSGEIIALESAILFQTGMDEVFDALIFVDAKDESVISRLESSGKFSRDDIVNRLKQQNYENGWKEDADFVIINDSDVEDFSKRCEDLIGLVKIISTGNMPGEPLRMID
jgi:dephospho-CoA kinase